MAVTLRTRARALRRGSAAPAIGVLFDEHAAMVLAICRYNLRDPQAAEDAAQETFLAAHRSLLGGTTPREPAAWLATIARNECRRTGRTPRPAPLDEATTGSYLDPADIVADRADLADVTGAIADLPDRQREALILREFCGLSYEQVAAAMSVSGAAVDSLLSRARKRLVEQLGEIPRAAQGTLLVPAAFREELERLIPGLEAGGAAAGAGGFAALSGLGSAPVAVKVAATCAATVAIGIPVQSTLRAEEGKQVDRPAAATVEPQRPRPTPMAAAPVVVDVRSSAPAAPTRVIPEDDDSSGPGSGDSDSSGPGDGSGSGSGSSGPGPGSGSDSSGTGSGSSGSSSGSGSSGHGSGSSGSGSGTSGSGSSGSGSGSSGSGSSGSGSGGSGSDSSGPGSGDD
jgi:RNA polymerase sigma factor (sigma-70 family)